MTATKRQPQFKLSAASIAVIQLFRAAKIGDIVAHEDIDAAVGEIGRERRQGAISTAIRVLRAEYRAVFHSVRSVGYKRLDDAEIIDASATDMRAIYRRTKTANERLGAADVTKLDKDQGARMAARGALFHLIGRTLTHKNVARLELEARTAGPKSLDLDACLRRIVNSRNGDDPTRIDT